LAESHSTLAENVAAALRESIYNGGHTIGERLIELTLAHEMNVSQNTVREALHILEQDGLVVKNPRRGVFVRAYTPDEAAELYALWLVVEGLALRWTIEMLTEADMDDLRELLSEARSQTEARNPLGAAESVLAFHEAIGRIAGKAQTVVLLNGLLNQIRLLESGVRHVRARRSFQQRRTQIDSYERLLKAIEDRHYGRAHQLLCENIEGDCETLLPLLDEV
jgi:DNA-binding GntR family transcriptional regulator